MMETARRSLTPFWILLAITALPFLAAWIVYFNPSLLGDRSTSNHGTLVTPPQPIPPMQLDTLDAAGFDTAGLAGNWTLLTVADSNCDRDCETNLYHLRQIRLAMGEERQRILRLLVLNDAEATDALRERIAPFEGTVIVTGPAPARDRLLEILNEGSGSGTTNRVFLIDPLGNLMMAYPPVPPANDVLKDLERVLEVVQL